MGDVSPTTSVLRDGRFVRLASARTISTLGTGFGRVALAFGVLALPGASPARLSLVLAAQALPQLVFVLAAGVIGDRFSRYRLMVAAELLAGVAWAALAAMVLTGWAPLAAVLVAAVAAGLGSALLLPAMTGVLPEFVSGEQLQQANALLRVGQNVALVLGLALSGVAVAVRGPGWAMALNAASFLVSAVLIAGMRLPSRARLASTALEDLRVGWREFTSRQWLWVGVVQSAFVLAAVMATVGVLGPLQSRDHLGGARAWALLAAAQAVGSVAGALLAGRVQARRPIRAAVVVTFVSALPMAALGAGSSLWVAVVAMFVCGIAADVFGVLWVTTLQREVPEEALSRVGAYDLFGSLAFAPLGLLVAGPLADVFGTAPTLLGCAGLVVLACLGALLSPSVRHLAAPQVAGGSTAPVSAPAGEAPLPADPAPGLADPEAAETEPAQVEPAETAPTQAEPLRAERHPEQRPVPLPVPAVVDGAAPAVSG